MFRIITVLVLFGLAIASGAFGLFAHNKHKATENEPSEEFVYDYEAIAAADLIKRAPNEQKPIEISEFHFGKTPVSFDYDDDGNWDKAYIPLFPKGNRVRKHNCVCIIFCTDSLESDQDAEKFFENQNVKGFYYPTKQELPADAFSKLAQSYGSIDYTKCIFVTNEAPEPPAKVSLALGAFAGFALFLCLAGWQTFSLLGEMKAKIDAEKKVKKVADAAGLSGLFEQNEKAEDKVESPSSLLNAFQSGENSGSLLTSSQPESSEADSGSFLEKWSQQNQS